MSGASAGCKRTRISTPAGLGVDQKRALPLVVGILNTNELAAGDANSALHCCRKPSSLSRIKLATIRIGKRYSQAPAGWITYRVSSASHTFTEPTTVAINATAI